MSSLSPKKKPLLPRRYAYLDDFQKTVTGEYIYTGDLFKMAGDKPMRKVIGGFVPFSAIVFVIIFVCGCFRVSGMSSCAYVLLPYCASIITSGVALSAILRLTFAEVPVRNYVFKPTVPRFKTCILLSAIFCCITFLGDILYIIIHGFSGYVLGTVIFLATHVIAILLLYFCRRKFMLIKWNRLDPDTGEETPVIE